MSTSTQTTPPEQVYSVAALTKSIRNNLLANNDKIAGKWIRGEISGCKLYSSGHRYFTLKDDDAVISCVLFAFRLGGCDDAFMHILRGGEEKANGVKVDVQGELELNMKRGQYSFKVSRLRVVGAGDKMAEFNALKAELEANGLNKLDHPELRRPLPFMPHRIAIVTSAAGAVIHDMCDVLLRRFPNLEVRLYPVKVQGEGAASSIAEGVRYFGTCDWRADVMIVGRGGGSMEDLWAFNEKEAVYAVAQSPLPVISAVGHESDVTLCDYVADLRAGTPSIAAERAVPVKAELAARMDELARRLRHAVDRDVETRISDVDNLHARLERVPGAFVENLAMRLESLRVRFAAAPNRAVGDAAVRIEKASGRLAPLLGDAVARRERRLQRVAPRLSPLVAQAVLAAEATLREQSAKLELLNPKAVLERGYSITMDASGRIVGHAKDVASGDVLVTSFADGRVESIAR